MTITPNPDLEDDPDFVGCVSQMLKLLVEQYRVDHVVYIQIKNWFDHKWLNFSGKSVIHFEKMRPYDIHAALEVQWRDKVTVPPFNPKRVVQEQFFRKKGNTNKRFERIVMHREQISNENIHNRITDYSKNGLFVWYSSHTKTNQRGSLMVYRVQNAEVDTWYASFKNRNGWTIIRTKGIGINEARAYLD